MDGGRSPPDRTRDVDGDTVTNSSGNTPDSDQDDNRGGVSHEGAVKAAAVPQGGSGDGGGDGQNVGTDFLPAARASGEGSGRRSISAGGSSRHFASVDDGWRQASRSPNHPSQDGSASQRSLFPGSGGGGSRGFASLDGPPRRSSWRQRLSLSLARPPPSLLGRPDSFSLDELVVDMDHLEQAAGDKGF